MKEKILSIFRNMRVRNKIIVIYIPLIILPLFFIIFTSNYAFTKSVMEKTKENISDETDLMLMKFDSIVSNVETCANIFTKDINVVLEKYSINIDDPVSFVTLRNQISNVISYNKNAFKEIDSGAVIDLSSNVISPDAGLLMSTGNVLESEIIRKLNMKGPPVNIWFPMNTRDYLVTDSKTPVISIGKRIVNIKKGEIIGFLILNIKEEKFSSIFPYTDSRGYYIIDNKGIVVSTQEKQALLKPLGNKTLFDGIINKKLSSFEVNLNNEPYLITTRPIKNFNWILVHQISVSELTKDIRANSMRIVIIALICTIFAFLGAYFLSRLIAKPIIKLTGIAEEVKDGNLEVLSDLNSNDEVGTLAVVFNQMIVKIKENLKREKSEQKRKREIEFALIQSQIKPHFLYNTLDLIYVLCDLENAREAANTTKALADFYRESLSKGKEVISIKKELKNVKDYLLIQKARYSEVFDFDFEISNEIMNFAIPKLTIQPLVENSIYHGLKPKNAPGRIQIKGYKREKCVFIEIIDDGVGMSENKLNSLVNYRDNEKDAEESFGYKSVDERIKLYFGENFGLKISSKPNEGTKVTIVVPSDLPEVTYV